MCVCVRVCTIYLSFQCLGLCILSNADLNKLYCVSLSIRCSPKWCILRLGGEWFLHVVHITNIYSQFLPSKFIIIIVIIISSSSSKVPHMEVTSCVAIVYVSVSLESLLAAVTSYVAVCRYGENCVTLRCCGRAGTVLITFACSLINTALLNYRMLKF
jgi:hypothetical protein